MTDETHGPGYFGQDEPPIAAVVEIDPVAEIDAGRIPWPPYRQVEAPPCGALIDIAADRTNDGHRRRFWCDVIAGEPHDQHRAVYDLEGGRALRWTNARPTNVEGPFRR